jgi:hypothetical protein
MDYLRGHLAEAHWHQLQSQAREAPSRPGSVFDENPRPAHPGSTADGADGIPSTPRDGSRLRTMPVPFLLAAKAGAVVNMARRMLAEWNRLDPSAKQHLQKEAADVRRSLFEVAGALGARLRDSNDEDLSWEDARNLALNPRADFVLAREIPGVVLSKPGIDETELRSALGNVVPQVFESALTMAEEDGFIERSGPGRWQITEFADEELEESDDVALMEAVIVEHIQLVGLATRDELALGAGCPDSTEAGFLDALERALVRGTVEWLGPGMYGLPAEQLAAMDSPDEKLVGSARGSKALKPSVIELAREVNQLGFAIASARARSGLSAAGSSLEGRQRAQSRSRKLAAMAVSAGARRFADDPSGPGDKASPSGSARGAGTQVLASNDGDAGIDDELRRAMSRDSERRDTTDKTQANLEAVRAAFKRDEAALVEDLKQAVHRTLHILASHGTPAIEDFVVERKLLGRDTKVRGWTITGLRPRRETVLAEDGSLAWTADTGEGQLLPANEWVRNEAEAAHYAGVDRSFIYDTFMTRFDYANCSHCDRTMRDEWPNVRARVMEALARVLHRAGVNP